MSNIKENDRSFDNYSTPRQDDHDPHEPATRPSHIPSNTVFRSVASRKKETVPPMIPNHSISFRGSESARKEDFRPTTPGNSHGVGHAFPDHEADVELKAIGKSQKGVGHSVNGFKYDYRPTAPGHSPGVGHVLQNKKGEPHA
ncbi:precursor of CEP9-like [Juglans microcarpa x Juglans regia]|uniref:precursor of CEP9-like n=1 Tax=Juglans microcarpa x Juglans regia TaxID=2249226 RepID=UPI001B7EFA90|nr:precursor of CEP9-like [Juglans microcarpa x Juglans regia]